MTFTAGRRLDYRLLRDSPVRVFDDPALSAEVVQWLASPHLAGSAGTPNDRYPPGPAGRRASKERQER